MKENKKNYILIQIATEIKLVQGRFVNFFFEHMRIWFLFDQFELDRIESFSNRAQTRPKQRRPTNYIIESCIKEKETRMDLSSLKSG